jgi:hypothetical protein
MNRESSMRRIASTGVSGLILFATATFVSASEAKAAPSARAGLGGVYEDLLKANGGRFASVQDC